MTRMATAQEAAQVKLTLITGDLKSALVYLRQIADLQPSDKITELLHKTHGAILLIGDELGVNLD